MTFELPVQANYPKPIEGPLVEAELHLRWSLPIGEIVPKLERELCNDVVITERKTARFKFLV